MKKYILSFLFYSQLYRLFQLFYRKKIIILMYHGFSDTKKHKGIENYQGNHINIELFRSQIKYIKENYNVISLNEYIKSCINNEKLPINSIIITIDDGYRSNYTLAFPILKEFDVSATIFLTTDFIENKNFLWVDRLGYAINNTKFIDLKLNIADEEFSFALDDYKGKMSCDKRIRRKLKSVDNVTIAKTIQQIEEKLNIKLSEAQNVPSIYKPLDWNEILEILKTSKVNIGSHTHKHLILARYDNEVIQNDLSLAKRLIEKKTGIRTELFCYPNGSIGDFNDNTKLILKKLGYSCALTTVRGMNSNISDLYELKRFGVGNTDLKSFIMDISGVKYFFSQMKMN